MQTVPTCANAGGGCVIHSLLSVCMGGGGGYPRWEDCARGGPGGGGRPPPGVISEECIPLLKRPLPTVNIRFRRWWPHVKH